MRKLLKRIGYILIDSDIPSHECLKIFDLIDEIEKIIEKYHGKEEKKIKNVSTNSKEYYR